MYISGRDINALIDVLNIELEALLNVQMLISSLSMLTKHCICYIIEKVSKMVI